MSLSDDKKNIFTTIGAYTSVMQATTLPDTTNIYPSINNKKDIVPLLLDILKVVVGTEALQELTGKLFTDFVDKIEPDIKKVLKNQFTSFNADVHLPTYFSSGGTGITIPLKKIDVYGKLKIKPDSKEGDLMYEKATLNFDKTAHDAIVNAGTDTLFGSSLIMRYDPIADTMTFKENPALGSTIGTWTNAFINDIAIINKKEFLSNIMNAIYGSISSHTGKSIEEMNKELQVNKAIEQLIDNDDDSFEISPDDYDTLLQKAQELVNGITYYDLGCGLMEVNFPLSGLTNLVSQISGSTDAFVVGNAIANTIITSTANNQSTTAANKQTIKDGFFQRLIKIIEQTLAQAVCTSPQIKAIMAITSAFQNGGIPILGEARDDLKKFKVMIKCNVNEMMKLLRKFIFNLVVSFLIALLAPIIKKIIKEKINQYVKQLKSLTVAST